MRTSKITFIACLLNLVFAQIAHGQSAANLCASSSPTRKISTTYSWTQAQLSEALRQANADVETWLAARSRGLSGVIFGPTLDATYFYRLGDPSLWDRDSLGKDLDRTRRDLLAQGFPTPQPSELTLIGFTNNRARARGAPSAFRCAKHFPGGDENLERTETDAVFYSNRSAIEERLWPFREVLKGDDPPPCMMLSHAQFIAQPFAGPEVVNLGPLLGNHKFTTVPASLNPSIVAYLKTQMGFHGVTIADWLNMDPVIQFLKKVPGGLSINLLALYAGTYAGVDYLPGAHFLEIEDLSREARRLSPKILKAWNDKLTEWMLDFAPRMQLEATPQQITKMSFEAKLAIKTAASRGEADREVVARFLSQADTDKLLKPFAIADDPWNRSGVMVLLQRQLAIESLLRSSGLVDPNFALGKPQNIEQETDWFARLKSNPAFRKAYDSIDWNSKAVQNLFCLVRDQRF